MDGEGRENIAPYSQWQNLTFDPPMVMFSANQYPDGRRKDTVLNAEETGWFVWNMATYDLREEVNKSAQVLDYGDSEWDRLSVTKEYADNYRIPMVKESPVKFECQYKTTLRVPGNSKVGSIDLVVADVKPSISMNLSSMRKASLTSSRFSPSRAWATLTTPWSLKNSRCACPAPTTPRAPD